MTVWTTFTDWLLRTLPDGFTEGWRKRREQAYRKSRPTYDAYPVQEHRPRVRIVLISGKFFQPVDLDGYDLNEINLRAGSWRRDWLLGQILEAFILINQKVDNDREAKNAQPQ